MNIEFHTSFLRDVKKINDKHILADVEKAIADVQAAKQIDEISKLTKMVGY
jgi:hypothetical protein